MKKRNSILFIAAVLALAFVGCSHDELAGGDGTVKNDSKDAVYMNVTVQLPAGPGTRSVTGEDGGSDSGTEIGLDHENKVHSVLLVLADKNNKFIGCAERSESLSTDASGKVTTVQSISKSVLSKYYGGDQGTLDADKQQINVFVFCNPTSTLRGVFENLAAENETWYNEVCNVSETAKGVCDNAAIWGGANHEGGFLMSSYEISTKKFPLNFSDWDAFTSVDKPFKLTGNNPNIGDNSDASIDNGNAIKVERSVARFDFKDASENKDRKYNVVKDPENENNYIMQIELQKMALVNMSKNFYYLRRVSDNGLSDGANYKLCGIETSRNYVVDTDADAKKNGTIAGNQYADHFNFCLGHTPEGGEWAIDPVAREQWFTSRISDVLGGEEDNDDKKDENGGWHEKPEHNDYRIWRYVTENTIPGEDNQNNGITTGIVFKGKMLAPEGSTGTLADALKNATGIAADDPILYVFGNEIFVRWTEVRAMAIQRGQGNPLYTAVFGNTTVTPVAYKKAEEENPEVKAVYSDDETSADYLWDKWFNAENKPSDNLKEFKAAATKEGFTLYESSSDPDYGAGYYCYYFYWNRHNNNGNAGVMGPMEFAVVRNNVYKLAVTKINRLGHPRVTENDPDPVDPDNPDEEGDVYLSVSVEVLPWVVRINNIEF